MIEVKSFVDGMGLFYSAFLKSSSDSITILADLQDKFKDEYDKLKQMQSDPSMALEKLGNLNEEEKDRLISMFVRIATLEKKMLKLFDSTSEEKRILAKELEEFEAKLNLEVKKSK